MSVLFRPERNAQPMASLSVPRGVDVKTAPRRGHQSTTPGRSSLGAAPNSTTPTSKIGSSWSSTDKRDSRTKTCKGLRRSRRLVGRGSSRTAPRFCRSSKATAGRRLGSHRRVPCPRRIAGEPYFIQFGGRGTLLVMYFTVQTTILITQCGVRLLN